MNINFLQRYQNIFLLTEHIKTVFIQSFTHTQNKGTQEDRPKYNYTKDWKEVHVYKLTDFSSSHFKINFDKQLSINVI
jgi:hypothetical protein